MITSLAISGLVLAASITSLLRRLNPPWIQPAVALIIQLAVLIWLTLTQVSLWMPLVVAMLCAISAGALKERVLHGRERVK